MAPGVEGAGADAVPACEDASSEERRQCGRAQCARCLAIAAPTLDVIFTIVVLLFMPLTTPAFGWTAQMPLMLCWFRQAGLLLFVGIAVLRGCRKSEPKWLEEVLSWLSEAFSYLVCMLLAAPCIARLVTEQPATVSQADATWYWAAIALGALCSALECYFTLSAIAEIHSYVQRRMEARRASSAADLPGANGHSDMRLGTELLAAEEGDVGSSSASSSSAAANTNAGSKKKEEKDKPKRPTVKKLLNLITHEWRLVIQASIFLLLAAVCEALVPHYIGDICSAIIKGAERGTLAERPYIQPVISLMIAGFACGLFSSCRGATFLWIGCKVSAKIRQDLYDTLASQEIGFFDTTKTGELTSRMTQDCQKITDQVTLNINVFLRTLVTMLTTLAFMLAISPPLTFVAFISVPVIAVISKKYGKFQQSLSEATQKSLAEANSVAEEGLSTMDTVRMFAAEGLESKRFATKLLTFMQLQQRQARFYIVYLTLTITLPNLTSALLLCYGGKLAMHGQLKPDQLLSFVFYLQTINGAFSTLGDFYSSIVQALGAATRVFELKERKPEVPLEPDPQVAVSDVERLSGDLKLIDVHFTYPARPDVQVLKGLSLEVPAGKTVALVGPSGNGKSTVISLFKRLYKAQEGEVLLDGIDVWRFTHQAFHRCISIVGQEPVLYARSIRENITYGLENPKAVEDKVPGCKCCKPALQDDDAVVIPASEVEDATRTANAYTFITGMPEGFDTQVGERGVQLSGGQKQRIAIARALVRQPRVLLLDEATSALDAESEKQVQQAIDGMIDRGQMTVIIIAHRLSTVRNSHKICVVQGGKVVEEGSHDKLVKKGGAYFNLVESQLSKPDPRRQVSSASMSSEG